MTNVPGVSMMEWRVSCGSGLAWGERLATKTSYLGSIGPEVENLRELLYILLFGLLRLIEGPRVTDTAMVLVQMACDKIYVPLFESLEE